MVELAQKVEFTHEVELTLMVRITTGDVSATLTVYNNVTVNGLQVTHCNKLSLFQNNGFTAWQMTAVLLRSAKGDLCLDSPPSHP